MKNLFTASRGGIFPYNVVDFSVFGLGIIRRCRKADRDPNRPASEQTWCLLTKGRPHRILGRHKTKQQAYKQEYAIKMSQKRRGMKGLF